MRTVRKRFHRGVLALAAMAAAAGLATSAALPAQADPPVPPKPADVVGVGAVTTQYLYDQFSHRYNASHPSPKLYSWDATGSSPIATKAGCAAIVRPDGSSAGIVALLANATVSGDFCIDYARSSQGPTSSGPQCVSGGICFKKMAGDAVTYATRDAVSGGTNAPPTLTLAQLHNIYACIYTNWIQVGGPNAPIHPFIPESSSGTGAFFLSAIGVTAPGPCVSSVGNTLQENQGVAPQLNDPDAVVPYSVPDYIAQVYHSAPCTVAGCGYPLPPTCTPSGQENLFGCDDHGVLGINRVAGTSPVTPWPPPAPPVPPAINAAVKLNSGFAAAFQHYDYTVFRWAPTLTNIPAYLEPFFNPASASPPGWTCQAAGRKIARNYGYLPITALCGT